MSASAAEQRVATALLAILDTAPALTALTGLASGNLRPADDASPLATSGLTYELGPTRVREGIGEAYDVEATITAEAPTRAAVRALLGTVEDLLTVAAFFAASADAMVTTFEPLGVVRGAPPRHPAAFDLARPHEVCAGALDLTIWITL